MAYPTAIPFTACVGRTLAVSEWVALSSSPLLHSAAGSVSRLGVLHKHSCSCVSRGYQTWAVGRHSFGSCSRTEVNQFAHGTRCLSDQTSSLRASRIISSSRINLRSIASWSVVPHRSSPCLPAQTTTTTRPMSNHADDQDMDSNTGLANGGLSEDSGPNPSDFLLPYKPAEWMKQLKNIPKQRVKLVHGATPIQRWYLPNVPADFEISIKRDDLTGSELSGNKARKLEFLLADAIQQGCSAVITCGSMQSNHCRATAIATRQLGLEPHLLLRSPVSDIEEVTCKGNMLLNRLIGAHIHLMPKKAQFATDIRPRLDQLVQKIKEETGEKAYPIIIGGSCAVGLFGYLDAFTELQQQGVSERFTDIVVACGSNGSTLGLALANYLTGSRLKVHGMIVSDDAKFHFDGMNQVLQQVEALDSNGKALRAEDIVNLVEGVKGLGYGLSTPEELDTVAEICTKTGIIIDPVYTGKSIRHLLRLARERPTMFKGNKILFVHTGGIFGLFDGRMDDTVRCKGLEQHRLHEWMELGERAPDMKL